MFVFPTSLPFSSSGLPFAHMFHLWYDNYMLRMFPSDLYIFVCVFAFLYISLAFGMIFQATYLILKNEHILL